MKIVEVEVEPCGFWDFELSEDSLDRFFEVVFDTIDGVDRDANENESFPRDPSKDYGSRFARRGRRENWDWGFVLVYDSVLDR